jgi:hypothetical protein
MKFLGVSEMTRRAKARKRVFVSSVKNSLNIREGAVEQLLRWGYSAALVAMLR